MQSVGLVPIRGWPHRVTRASKGFAGGDAHCVVKLPPRSRAGGVGRSVRRGCQAPPGRPHHVRQRAHCIVKPPPSRLGQGWGGEKRLQLRVFVTRPWCGPGGYIQVGKRGVDEWAGIVAAVPAHSWILLHIFGVVPSRPLPSGGGEHSRGLALPAALALCLSLSLSRGGAPRPIMGWMRAGGGAGVSASSWLSLQCPDDQRGPIRPDLVWCVTSTTCHRGARTRDRETWVEGRENLTAKTPRSEAGSGDGPKPPGRT